MLSIQIAYQYLKAMLEPRPDFGASNFNWKVHKSLYCTEAAKHTEVIIHKNMTHPSFQKMNHTLFTYIFTQILYI